MRLARVIASLVALGVAAPACGGGVSQSAEANAVARATEPRENDPTAARPVPRTGPSSAPAPSTNPSVFPPRPAASAQGAPAPGDDDAEKNEKNEKADPVPTKIAARHVLIQHMGSQKAPPSVVRTRDQASALAQEVLRRARAGEDFARLAVEFSDEPGAGGRGGSLGRFGKGAMVPQFEEAAFKLKVGEISDVVETPFGFHVIQRTE